MHSTARALMAMTLTLGVAVGCGNDDAKEAATTTTTASTTPSAPAATVEVTTVDYAFEGLSTELDAGTSITVRNTSAAELHELVALRLPDDERRSVAELAKLPPQELEALFAAPPALVAVAPPGKDGFVALGDGTLSEPGRYAVFCFIPTGADPQAYLDALEANPGQPPQVEGGPPHFVTGMYTELVVA
jgi:plastocyanin